MRVVGLLVSLLWLSSGTFHADDWPGYRGSRADGTSAEKTFSDLGTLGLKLDWRQGIGSGYSGVSIAEGRVVTMFSTGSSDVVAAFDEATGTELWRHTLEATYRGHDGSHDGPLATPLIAEGRVFCLSALGKLLGWNSTAGSVLWSLDLPRGSFRAVSGPSAVHIL